MPMTVKATRFAFRQLLELDACTRCGECVKWCPTFAEKQDLDEITPLRKIERVRCFLRAQALGPLGRLFGYRRATEETLQMLSAGTYDCTLCGRCATVCPVNIQTRSMWWELLSRMTFPVSRSPVKPRDCPKSPLSYRTAMMKERFTRRRSMFRHLALGTQPLGDQQTGASRGLLQCKVAQVAEEWG